MAQGACTAVVTPGLVLAPTDHLGLSTALVLATPVCNGNEYSDECDPSRDSPFNEAMGLLQTGPTGLVLDFGVSADKNAKEKPQFKDEAMRVLEECEQLLHAPRAPEDDRKPDAALAKVLADIALLKRRYSRSVRASSPAARCSIARQRRFSLGIDARRILKNWVDDNLEDPYPTVQEKQELGASAGLTMKQVNDWFTNYRKRHWEDEMMAHQVDRNEE